MAFQTSFELFNVSQLKSPLCLVGGSYKEFLSFFYYATYNRMFLQWRDEKHEKKKNNWVRRIASAAFFFLR